jgi:hydrogenase maturation protein HypF
MSKLGAHERRRIEFRGRVQGVGFRPFVYRIACELELQGFAGNDLEGAFAEVQGPPASLARFVERLQSERPPLAQIDAIEQTAKPLIAPDQEAGFSIVASERNAAIPSGQDAAAAMQLAVTPDAATCDDCQRELFDAADRRHRYPFINCTNCGPRYSIIKAVPYDRPQTTMAAFAMCERCQAEYDDPKNRRHHAQPNACPVCGPRLTFVSCRLQNSPVIEGDAFLRSHPRRHLR